MRLRELACAAAFALSAQAGLAADDGLLALHVEMQDGTEVQLSLGDLDALEQVEFSTSTIWTDGPITFSGVPVLSVLAETGGSGETLRMVALNDYAIEMPIAELETNAPIVATRMDGEPMPVRDKGPFWVVYPYDASPDYATETAYSRSVWQLSRLVVID